MNEEVKGIELELRQGELMVIEEAGEENEKLGFTLSAELKTKMSILSAKQRWVIVNLVMRELQGVPRARSLWYTTSCPHCGAFCADGGALERHLSRCLRRRANESWKFLATRAQFYKWLQEPIFAECLKRASQEASDFVLGDAFVGLKYLTLEAVNELGWQVRYGRDERNRQTAAIAILDRAGIETADKRTGQPQQLQLWLEGLRRAGEEGEDEDWEEE
jgi:hypothetical protein